MLALASDDALCALEFTTVEGRPRPGAADAADARLGRWFPPHDCVDEPKPRSSRAPRDWLDRHISPDGRATIGDLPLDMRGAPFEQRSGQALREIPPGETTSYGAIARGSVRPARRERSARPTAPTRSRSSCPATASSARTAR